MAALDQLTGLMSVINGLKGQSQTTTTGGGTTTQQTNVSDAGINQLINQILSGSGGVKSIGARARSSGLYNSTSEDTLLGNLYATAANQAELARSPTTVTTAPTTSTTTQKGAGVGDLVTGLGTAFLASQALNIGAKALGPSLSSGSDYLSDLLGGLFGNDTSSSGSTSKRNTIGDTIFTGTGGGFGSDGGTTGTGISTGEGFGLNTGSLGRFGGTGQGGTGLNFGLDLDDGTGSVGVGGMGIVGSLLGSIVSGFGSSGGGASGGGAGGSGGTTGGSIICTALMARGLLDADHYAAGDKYIQSVPLHVKVGYYVWAENIADKIAKGHKGWTKLCLPFAASRTALLATAGTFMDHVKNPLGTLTKFIGEPVCGIIGKRVLARVAKTKLNNVQGA